LASAYRLVRLDFELRNTKMPPQKRNASTPSMDDDDSSNEESDLSTKRPCRIRPRSDSVDEAARSLAPSPDCVMTMNNDNSWWLRRHSRTRTNDATTTVATSNSTHELRCRFCQVALPGDNGSRSPDASSARRRPARPSVTLLHFYAASGRNNGSTSSSMVDIQIPADAGSRTVGPSENQCCYCDRTDQCGQCMVQCNPCGGLVFCLFCRAYDTQGAMVCPVCRSDLSDEAILPSRPVSSSFGPGVRKEATAEATEREDAMELG
jgi:hypothetical protein